MIDKGQKAMLAFASAAAGPYFLHTYFGRFVICRNDQDNARGDLKKWDILWFRRWNAHNRDVLRTGELVYSQRMRKRDMHVNSRQNFLGFFLGEVNSVRTTVCICCGNEMASKVMLTWAENDGAEDKSSWVNSGMIKFRKPFRIWPVHRIGCVTAPKRGDEQQKKLAADDGTSCEQETASENSSKNC